MKPQMGDEYVHQKLKSAVEFHHQEVILKLEDEIRYRYAFMVHCRCFAGRSVVFRVLSTAMIIM